MLPILCCKGINIVCRKLLHLNLMKWILSHKANQLSGKYDVAISYEEGDCAHVVAKMDCINKLIWIHNDYEWIAEAGASTDFECFDKICCVSEATRQSFIKVYPHLEAKTVTIYNLVNTTLITQKAKQPVTDDRFISNDLFTVVSVGRICYQKQFDVIPIIVSKLKKDGIKLKWYIIGKGPDEGLLDSLIAKYEVSDSVVRLGEQYNPYPYIAKANLFALTSRYESYPTVINEALALGTPIISTPIPPAFEMLTGTRRGGVVPLESWPEHIENYMRIETKHSPYDFSARNMEILQHFYQLINNR